jgi:anti-sigma B factor antagonist
VPRAPPRGAYALGRLPIGVETEERAGELRIVLSGELDVSTAPAVEGRLLEIEDADDPPPHVVIDLRALRFIDSTGLSLLVNTHKRARAAGRGLTIVAGPGPARRILETTGLLDRLDVVQEQGDERPTGAG